MPEFNEKAMQQFNENLIKEFRANGGKAVSGPFVNAPLLLLTTTGAKSGKPGADGLFAGDDELTRARRAEEIARVTASYPLDPKMRLRSWEGWWASSIRACPPQVAKNRQLRPSWESGSKKFRCTSSKNALPASTCSSASRT